MVAHDTYCGRTPTVAATAVAIVLAFAPAKAQASIIPILCLYGTGRLGPHPLLTLDPVDESRAAGVLLVVALQILALCVVAPWNDENEDG